MKHNHTHGVQATVNRCGYCGQDMIPGSECRTSASADQCEMYREFAATRKVDAGVALPDAKTEHLPDADGSSLDAIPQEPK